PPPPPLGQDRGTSSDGPLLQLPASPPLPPARLVSHDDTRAPVPTGAGDAPQMAGGPRSRAPRACPVASPGRIDSDSEPIDAGRAAAQPNGRSGAGASPWADPASIHDERDRDDADGPLRLRVDHLEGEVDPRGVAVRVLEVQEAGDPATGREDALGERFLDHVARREPDPEELWVIGVVVQPVVREVPPVRPQPRVVAREVGRDVEPIEVVLAERLDLGAANVERRDRGVALARRREEREPIVSEPDRRVAFVL